MPELPEVQTVINTILPSAKGAVIRAVDVRRREFVTPGGIDIRPRMVGRTILDITRRGKRIIALLDDGQRFLIHLGMTGRVSLLPPESPRVKHAHVVIALTSRSPACRPFELHLIDPRRFGELHWLGSSPGDDGLGIEPFDLTPARLGEVLAGSSRPIKNLLLDQKHIAGLGNIYADECLFACGIHPLTPADTIADKKVRELCRAIKGILRRAIRHHGSSVRDYADATGAKGFYQQHHKVYGRENGPCRICGTSIHRIVLAGRSACFCPKCQCLKTARRG